MQQRVRLHARYQVLKAPFPQSSAQKKRSHPTVNAAALSVLVPGSSSVDHHFGCLGCNGGLGSAGYILL